MHTLSESDGGPDNAALDAQMRAAFGALEAKGAARNLRAKLEAARREIARKNEAD